LNVRQIPERIAVGLIRGYQWTLSPFIGNQCRFHPSCSSYALEAIKIHGVVSGIGLAVRRLGKCHPFNPGGFDPVPTLQEIHEERHAHHVTD
jgi:putative membrane protein insertion efficiency factor